MDDEYEPTSVEVLRDERVTIEFLDGHVAQFDLVTLRRGCPCATCRDLRDRGLEAWPRPGSPSPLRVVDADFHGAWGLAITWNDGHRTGIYGFEFLRSWHERTSVDPNPGSDLRNG